MTTPEDPFQTPAEGESPTPPPPPYVAPPAAPPAYGGQPPQYGAPPPGYGAPPPGYGTPPGGYGGPPPGWAGGYGPPTPTSGYASWGKQVGATLLDAVIVIPFVIVAVIFFAIGHGIGPAIGVIAYIGAIAFGLWNQVFRQGKTGQTIGKQQLGIKVIREADGQIIGPGMTFVRQLAHVLDSITCYIGYLWPLWDDKRQTFADKVIGTIVINV
jgi:uncharacterized RDD family membrane protein YckC